jgi:threonine synthase
MTPFRYRCTECGRTFARDAVRYLCPDCGPGGPPGEPLRGVLEAVLDETELRRALDARPGDLRAFLPVEPEFHPAYPVGNTPLVAVPGLGAALGFERLLVKNDALEPSGSLKDRASFLVVAEAIRLGEPRVVTASTGNAASALAAVCAATDREAVIFVPKTAPRAKLVQMLVHGARVVPIDGTYDDAFRLSLEYTRERGGLNRNTAYHPLTIEGKKTVALEIFFQLGGRAPDAVVVPVGDGVILAGVWKGFTDLVRCGRLDRLPRLVAVQAEGSAAIHRFVTTGIFRKVDVPDTIADSIAVGVPSNARLARKAIEESGGFSLTVSDEEILEAQGLLARTTGIFAEPSAAAVVAALPRVDEDRLDRGSEIVLLVTGHGLKDVEAPLARLSLPDPVPATLDAVP